MTTAFCVFLFHYINNEASCSKYQHCILGVKVISVSHLEADEKK